MGDFAEGTCRGIRTSIRPKGNAAGDHGERRRPKRPHGLLSPVDVVGLGKARTARVHRCETGGSGVSQQDLCPGGRPGRGAAPDAASRHSPGDRPHGGGENRDRSPFSTRPRPRSNGRTGAHGPRSGSKAGSSRNPGGFRCTALPETILPGIPREASAGPAPFHGAFRYRPGLVVPVRRLDPGPAGGRDRSHGVSYGRRHGPGSKTPCRGIRFWLPRVPHEPRGMHRRAVAGSSRFHAGVRIPPGGVDPESLREGPRGVGNEQAGSRTAAVRTGIIPRPMSGGPGRTGVSIRSRAASRTSVRGLRAGREPRTFSRFSCFLLGPSCGNQDSTPGKADRV